MRINIEALLTIMDAACEAEKDYQLCVKRKPVWGCEPYVEYSDKKDKWWRDYEYVSHEANKTSESEYAIFEVLNITRETATRARIARRAWKRWYERTQWQKCATDEMMKKLGDWIFAEKSEEHYDMFAEIGDKHRFTREVYAEFTNYTSY